MAIIYNADEIYEIGISIEQNGRQFYSMAADGTRESGTRKLLVDLVDWETQHIMLFEQMRANLKNMPQTGSVDDPDSLYHAYLKAAADSHVFVVNSDINAVVKKCTTPQEILRMALGFEKDSVVLYSAMQRLVTPSLGQETIGRLVGEEIGHISYINQVLSELGQ